MSLSKIVKHVAVLAAFGLFAQPGMCQGTLQIGFEGPAYIGAPHPQPPGTFSIGEYSESGMFFHNPFGPESVTLMGGGLSWAPDNGTAYLADSGGSLSFQFSSGRTFNLLSFDLAEDRSGAETVQVVGHKGMGMTVTNTFTTDGVMDGPGGAQDFQKFYFDSQFLGVWQVDLLSDRWAIDNLMISGVPEPTFGGLMLLGALCLACRSRIARSR